MGKDEIINVTLKKDIDNIINNIVGYNKGKIGNREVINIDLKVDEVEEYISYVYKYSKDRDFDYVILNNIITNINV